MDNFDAKLRKIMDAKKNEITPAERQVQELRDEGQAAKDAAEHVLKRVAYVELKALAEKLHLNNVPHVKAPHITVSHNAWEAGIEVGGSVPDSF